MERIFVWEADYGVRNHLLPVLGTLLDEQDATSLQMLGVFVNNVPYNLEFYIVLSYDQPKEYHVDKMIELLKDAKLKYRSDLTFEQIFLEMGKRRFNSMTFINSEQLNSHFDSFFDYPEKRVFIENGYNCLDPISEKSPVFLSHQEDSKEDIRELIPFLNAANLPVWFDEISIDYGKSLTKEIQMAIKNSGAVIFWITKKFLNSGWCDAELQNFLQKYVNKPKEVLIIPIIHKEVDLEDFENVFLTNLKKLQMRLSHL
jgi:hypothetical protein